MANLITPRTKTEEFNAWARKFGVSTLWDNDKFENREFLKMLDEARPIYQAKNKEKQKHNLWK
jgi:hypothetical protein